MNLVDIRGNVSALKNIAYWSNLVMMFIPWVSAIRLQSLDGKADIQPYLSKLAIVDPWLH